MFILPEGTLQLYFFNPPQKTRGHVMSSLEIVAIKKVCLEKGIKFSMIKKNF